MTKAEKIAQLEGEVGSWEALTKARQDLGLTKEDIIIDCIPSIEAIVMAYESTNNGKKVSEDEFIQIRAMATAIARVP